MSDENCYQVFQVTTIFLSLLTSAEGHSRQWQAVASYAPQKMAASGAVLSVCSDPKSELVP